MEQIWIFALKVFAGYFAIMNPVANVPVFLGLTGKAERQSRRHVARVSTMTAFAIVVCFAFLGKYIFELFGLTIPAFKIFGGVLVVVVGFRMLMSHSVEEHPQDVHFDESISIAPLATPILAGPGTIVTTMDFASNADFLQLSIITITFGLMAFLTYIAFISGEYVQRKIGVNKITVVSKLMGLIIGVIGTNMVVQGVRLAFELK